MTLNNATLDPGGTHVPPTPSTPPASPPATPPGQQTGAGSAAGQTPAPPPTGTAPGQTAGSGGNGETTLTLSPEKLKERLEQAERSGVRELLKALGFTDLDSADSLTAAQTDLAKLLKFAREQQDAQLTAEQRVQKQIDDLTQRAEIAEKALVKERGLKKAAEDKLAESEKQQVIHRRNQAVMTAAVGARHPEDVVAWAEKNKPDDLKKVIKDDGSIDEAAAKALVEACRQDRKEYFDVVLGSPSNAGAQLPNQAAQIVQSQAKAARQTAKF